MRRFLVGAMAAMVLTGAMAGQAQAVDPEIGGLPNGDLLSGNDANFVQLSLSSLAGTIAQSSIGLDFTALNGGVSAGVATGDISGLSQETTGGINVMMVSTGALSIQQSVVSTNTSVEGLPPLGSVIAGANQLP